MLETFVKKIQISANHLLEITNEEEGKKTC